MAVFSTLLLAYVLSQTPPENTTPPKPPESGQPTPAPTQPPQTMPPTTQPKGPMTDAERIADAHDSITRNTQAIAKVKARLEDPKGEYKTSEREFEALNAKLKNLKMMAAMLRDDKKEAEAVAVEANIKKMMEDWQIAKDRFDLAIRQKKASLDAIEGLKERITSDQQLLDRLEGKHPKEQPGTGTGTPATPGKESPTTPATGTEQPTQPKQPETVPQPKTVPDPKTLPETLTKGGTTPANPAPAATGTDAAKPATSEHANIEAAASASTDPLVAQTRNELALRKAALQAVLARVRVAEERVRVMERSVRTSENMRQLENESIAQSEKAVAKLKADLAAMPPPSPEDREALTKKLAETEQRLSESRERVKRINERIGELTDTLNGLKEELSLVNKEAELDKNRVSESEAELVTLLNPTSARNMWKWVYTKGPHLLVILLGTLLVHLIVRQCSRHIVALITRNSVRGSPEDRQNRAYTLVGVFRYAAGLVIFGGGLVMALDEIGVPIVTLLGGAAVFGLAVAFGAQNLIRDYFTGFMMLLEDQYSVNDVVKIGTIAGQVEQITLRMTVLRDQEGIRHFIPHGTITCVSNMTHGWSRAMFEISVGYKENADKVIAVLMDLSMQMRLDSKLGRFIVEDPEMLGVDALSDSGFVVKFLLKTRPLKQWDVKREMLRRIKNRFDQEGIEIPFPSRSVYHHMPEATPEKGIPWMGNDRPMG